MSSSQPSVLNITDDKNDAAGGYHVNQFRIYFQITGSSIKDPANMLKDLIRKDLIGNDLAFSGFMNVFNGADGEGKLQQNSARVHRVEPSRGFSTRETLAFQLDILEALADSLHKRVSDVVSNLKKTSSDPTKGTPSIPDIPFFPNLGEEIKKLVDGIIETLNTGLSIINPHEDWVYVIPVGSSKYKKENGFCVQTLKRTRNDVDKAIEDSANGVLASIDNARSFLHSVSNNLPRLPFDGEKNIRNLIEDVRNSLKTLRPLVLIAKLNRMHFLAGRRSWALGVEPKGRSGAVGGNIKDKSASYIYNPSEPSPVFYLETAAVERSSKLGENVERLIPVRDEVIHIWKTMLSNYVKATNEYILVNQSPAPPQVDGPKWSKNADDGVWYRSHAFKVSEFEKLKSTKWVQSILELHPPLGVQIQYYGRSEPIGSNVT